MSVQHNTTRLYHVNLGWMEWDDKCGKRMLKYKMKVQILMKLCFVMLQLQLYSSKTTTCDLFITVLKELKVISDIFIRYNPVSRKYISISISCGVSPPAHLDENLKPNKQKISRSWLSVFVLFTNVLWSHFYYIT